jgi:hypothetical protein
MVGKRLAFYDMDKSEKLKFLKDKIKNEKNIIKKDIKEYTIIEKKLIENIYESGFKELFEYCNYDKEVYDKIIIDFIDKCSYLKEIRDKIIDRYNGYVEFARKHSTDCNKQYMAMINCDDIKVFTSKYVKIDGNEKK